MPASPKELLSPLLAALAAIALASAVFAIYSPALNFKFILDDHHFINDPRLQSSGHIWEYFTSYVWAQTTGGPSSFYRPVFVVWLRLCFILSEMSSWGWHLLSIAKHLLVALLLGLLVLKLLRDRVAALIAGTLFALHPAQTESVAWVTVPDPIMSAAALGTLLLYLKYAESLEKIHPTRLHRRPSKRNHKNSRARSWWWLVFSAAACLAALMSKETAIMLPAVIFVMAFAVPSSFVSSNSEKAESGRGISGLRVRIIFAFREALPFLLVTVIYLGCRLNALHGRLTAATQHLPWRTVLLSAPATLWFYVKVLLWPIRSRAFADPDLADHFAWGSVIFPALALTGLLATLICACFWAWRKAQRELPVLDATGVKRALALGTSVLILPILPTLNPNALNPGDFLHGRYTYLPLAGLLILIATIWHLAPRNRLPLLAVAGLIAATFSVLTLKQEKAWENDLSVFTVAHEIAPHNGPVAQGLARAHVQVALALDEAGECDQAVPMFEQAIQQYPQDWFAWAGLGECLFKLNDLPGAERSLHRAADLSHEPKVKEEWEQIREKMGFPPPA
jgi:hypothetical protein